MLRLDRDCGQFIGNWQWWIYMDFVLELVLLWEGSGRASSMGWGKSKRCGFGGSEPSVGIGTIASIRHKCKHNTHPQVSHWFCQDLCKCNSGLCSCQGCGISPYSCLWNSFCFWSLFMFWEFSSPWRVGWYPSQALSWIPNPYQVSPFLLFIYVTLSCVPHFFLVKQKTI